MKVTTEQLENRQVALTIEVEPERVNGALQRAAKKLADRGKIPGYRKGKAPFQIVRRHYGEDALYEEAAEDLAQKVYSEALDEAKIEPYAQGHLDEMAFKPDMVFKLTVPLKPVVQLNAYRDVRLPESEVAVSDEDVDQEIERLRRQRAIWKPAGRPAAMGDGVVLSYTASVGGQQFAERESEPMELSETSGPFPGFARQLVGAGEGETKEFTLSFPEDWPDKERAGKPADWVVSVELVREQDLPEVNDDLAKLVGEYDTLDQLRAKLRERLLERARSDADDKYTGDALDKMVEGAVIEYPPVIVEDEMDGMLDATSQRLDRQGQDLDTYLKLADKTREEYRESLRDRAVRQVRRSLVMSEVATAERLVVSDEELQQSVVRLESAYRQAGMSPDVLYTRTGASRMYMSLLSDKAMERIAAIAKGQAPELAPEPLPEAAPAPDAAPASEEASSSAGAEETEKPA